MTALIFVYSYLFLNVIIAKHIGSDRVHTPTTSKAFNSQHKTNTGAHGYDEGVSTTQHDNNKSRHEYVADSLQKETIYNHNNESDKYYKDNTATDDVHGQKHITSEERALYIDNENGEQRHHNKSNETKDHDNTQHSHLTDEENEHNDINEDAGFVNEEVEKNREQYKTNNKDTLYVENGSLNKSLYDKNLDNGAENFVDDLDKESLKTKTTNDSFDLLKNTKENSKSDNKTEDLIDNKTTQKYYSDSLNDYKKTNNNDFDALKNNFYDKNKGYHNYGNLEDSDDSTIENDGVTDSDYYSNSSDFDNMQSRHKRDVYDKYNRSHARMNSYRRNIYDHHHYDRNLKKRRVDDNLYEPQYLKNKKKEIFKKNMEYRNQAKNNEKEQQKEPYVKQSYYQELMAKWRNMEKVNKKKKFKEKMNKKREKEYLTDEMRDNRGC